MKQRHTKLQDTIIEVAEACKLSELITLLQPWDGDLALTFFYKIKKEEAILA